MPEGDDQPVKPLRTWRPMAAWTAGILLALGLVWLVGAVVVPVWQVHLVVNEVAAAAQGQPQSHMPLAVSDLGEPRRAAAKIRLYLRVWRPSGVQESGALGLYAAYASRSSEAALAGLGDRNPLIRLESVSVLSHMGDTRDIVPALERALKDDDERVRAAAAEALKKIRGEVPGK